MSRFHILSLDGGGLKGLFTASFLDCWERDVDQRVVDQFDLIVGTSTGGIIALACVATFVTRGQGTPAPFDPPRKFVAAGPYKFVRNPMYIGGFIVLLGFGLFQQSAAILLFTLPWFLFAHLFVIFYEEPHLRATFGEPYNSYCRSVHRWLPATSHFGHH